MAIVDKVFIGFLAVGVVVVFVGLIIALGV